MKNIINEFKAFAIRGNVVDMAIGIVVGTAFNKVVSSVVNDLFMPFLSLFLGKTPLRQLKWKLSEEIAVNYGEFLQVTIDFILIAFSAFIIVKAMNTLKDKAENTEVKTVPTPKDIQLLSEIRDLLKSQKD